MGSPTTRTGRALWDADNRLAMSHAEYGEAIAAIEADARAERQNEAHVLGYREGHRAADATIAALREALLRVKSAGGNYADLMAAAREARRVLDDTAPSNTNGPSVAPAAGPSSVAGPTLTAGAALIRAERIRQIEKEGFDAAHDAGHAEELALAGASYALAHRSREEVRRYLLEHGVPEPDASDARPTDWPWDDDWWKPTPDDRVRELVKAGALIAAAIDAHLGRAGT